MNGAVVAGELDWFELDIEAGCFRLRFMLSRTREMSADGIALGRRVGATLVNLECSRGKRTISLPSWWRMQVYNPMLARAHDQFLG
jgi:hypothetical protein